MSPSRKPGIRDDMGRPRELALALGGGGAFGIAFHLGFLHGLEHEGLPLRESPMIGVSAGAWAAAALAVDTPLEAIIQVWCDPSLCAARPAPVQVATNQVFGEARDARVDAVVINSRGRRQILNGAEHGLATVVAAASSPPVLAVPYVLRGRRVYDAGVVYNTCADLAPPARTLVVLAPLRSGTLGRQGAIWERRLQWETATRRHRRHGRLVVLGPSPAAVRSAGSTWDDVFSGYRMADTYAIAFEDGIRRAASLRPQLADDD